MRIFIISIPRHIYYFCGIQSMRMRWGHATYKEKNTVLNRILVGKAEGKRPLERSRRGKKNNTTIHILKTHGGRAWTGLI